MNLYALLTVFIILDVCQAAVHSPCPVNPDPLISSMAQKDPSLKVDRFIYGAKSGAFIQILRDGTVNGTWNTASEYAKLQLQVMGREVVRIKGIETGRYVAMNRNGSLYSTASPSDETLFMRTSDVNYKTFFASMKYCVNVLFDMYIALGKNGDARNGKTTKVGERKIEFYCFRAQQGQPSLATSAAC